MAMRDAWTLLLVAAASIWAWASLDLDTHRIGQAWPAAKGLWADMWPPVLEPTFRERVFDALLETIQIAVLATVFGFILSLPLGILSARNLMPRAISEPLRLLAAAIRVLPSILWAILMVLIFGFGPLAGVVAMTFYTIGYLAKLQYEAYEGLQRDALDAVRAMGANRFQVAWHVVLPEAQNALRSQALFMFEYNVRSSTVIGVVGAGGIGQLLGIYLDFFDYGRVLTILIFMFVTVVVIDGLSYLVRRRYLELDAPRARWRDVFIPWDRRQ